METALEFYKLEKIELGGIQGKQLSAQVLGVHAEFCEQYKVFSERTYDCLDTKSHVRFSISEINWFCKRKKKQKQKKTH